MKTALMATAAAVVGFGALALSGAPASAAVVCNGMTCWHTKEAYTYPPHVGVVVHDDHWRWGHNDHYAWHEHAGRGYWRNNVWITF
jgi:hypothetical protein